MPLLNRNRPGLRIEQNDDVVHSGGSSRSNSSAKLAATKKQPSQCQFVQTMMRLAVVAFIAMVLIVFRSFQAPDPVEITAVTVARTMLKGNTDRRTLATDLGSDATLVLYLERAAAGAPENAIALGPHGIQIQSKKKYNTNCKNLRVWVRLVGNVLVHVDLMKERMDNNNNNVSSWVGSFIVPVPGSYAVDARWYACQQGNIAETTWQSLLLREPLILQAVGSVPQPTKKKSRSMFAQGSYWTASRLIPIQTANLHPLPDYIWMNPQLPAQERNLLSTNDTIVLKEGTVRQPRGLYRFSELGNGELLCFIGSASAAHIRSAFLQLLPQLFPRQRPFKFHYYNVTSLVRPDQYWDWEQKEKVRKCKNILVSVDELQDLFSQDQYKSQAVQFVEHLTRLIPDETFPIWIFTVNEPAAKASNCHTPSLRQTTNHPCNDVWKHLFRRASRQFPARVKLLDNTDLTLPHFDSNAGSAAAADILAVIALRVYVLVGQQVATWRTMGQVNGMYTSKNGTTIPANLNELEPYEAWS